MLIKNITGTRGIVYMVGTCLEYTSHGDWSLAVQGSEYLSTTLCSPDGYDLYDKKKDQYLPLWESIFLAFLYLWENQLWETMVALPLVPKKKIS